MIVMNKDPDPLKECYIAYKLTQLFASKPFIDGVSGKKMLSKHFLLLED